jgi:hypothetical protein
METKGFLDVSVAEMDRREGMRRLSMPAAIKVAYRYVSHAAVDRTRLNQPAQRVMKEIRRSARAA